MRKLLKVTLFVFAVLFASVLCGYVFYFLTTAPYSLDENKLVNLERGVIFYDSDGEIIDEQSGGVSVTNIEELPEHLLNAFIAIEDKRFYSHKGTDAKSLVRATLNNLKSFSFKEGASTISQQLIKNTHLSSEKTLKRKLVEIKLAKDLEKKYDKNEILEKYLNTIYFGNNNYGITKAAEAYFGKTPSMLSINESAALAATVKAPSVYSPCANSEKCNRRKNLVLAEMFKQGYLSGQEYNENKEKTVSVKTKHAAENDYLSLVNNEIAEFIDKSAYKAKKFKVFTALDKDKQSVLQDAMKETDVKNKAMTVMNRNGEIIAYKSTVVQTRRNLGSTIKPLLVYAPAYENKIVYPCTLLYDEKTDFSGYSPSNFNDKYYGKISVKESLAKSLNVCAVKLLNLTGIKESLYYLKKTDIPVTENDDSLAVALGATEKGATLSEIVSAYGTFMTGGNYTRATCVKKITDENDKTIYSTEKRKVKIFGTDTANLINDALKSCVEKGTAKQLSFTGIPLCAKTGTAGNSNGNTDAYCISYNNDYVLGVWCGNHDSELLDNSITGGTIPAELSISVWQNFYKTVPPPQLDFNEGLEFLKIDKISYEKDGTVILADPLSPKRYEIEELFSENHIPKTTSSIFSSPKLENVKMQVNNNEITISLCQTQYIEARIIKEENGKETIIYDTKKEKRKNEIKDIIKGNKEIKYFLVPYFINDDKEICGEKTLIGTVKISKIPSDAPTQWWDDEFS